MEANRSFITYAGTNANLNLDMPAHFLSIHGARN
jgi:hypothetical protein